MKYFIIIIVLILSAATVYVFYKKTNTQKKEQAKKTNAINKEKASLEKKLKQKSVKLKQYAKSKNYDTAVLFLADYSIHSGKYRFFVYDGIKDSVIHRGLVSHGSCNTRFLANVKFDNTVGCGCSAIGKYKISYAYNGQFGKAYKLIGLDKTNNNSFERNIVLHAWDYPKDTETYPQHSVNSLGCPMVSYNFLNTLTNEIKKARRPVLLEIFN